MPSYGCPKYVKIYQVHRDGTIENKGSEKNIKDDSE